MDSDGAYPVHLEIDYPDRLSRLLIFVKWLLAIPHYIALFFLGIGAAIATLIAWFAVIITGRYPRSLFDYNLGVHRWGLRVSAYLLLLTDAYPPFALEDDRGQPVRLNVDYPERVDRWRPLLNWLLALPVALVAGLMIYVAYAVVFLAWFAILFTGRFPQGLFKIVAVALRWQANVNFYIYWMTAQYPPLAWD
jgi:uncharacterized protein DUF4389